MAPTADPRETAGSWPSLFLERYSAAPVGDEGRRASRERRAFVASLLVHASIIAAFVVSFDLTSRPKPEPHPQETMTVSLLSGQGTNAAIPRATSSDKRQDRPTDQPRQEAVAPKPQERPQERPDPRPSEGQPAENVAPIAGTPGGGTIWTPPAPDPNASGIRSDAQRPEHRVEMPKVVLAKGASEPVLMSYDQGRFSDAAAVAAAAHLNTNGTITMAVDVDEKGAVKSCVVTATSGSRLLDERGCLLVSSYLYRPAQDEKGGAHAAVVTEVLEWAKDGKFVSPADATPADQAALRSAESRMPKVQQPK